MEEKKSEAGEAADKDEPSQEDKSADEKDAAVAAKPDPKAEYEAALKKYESDKAKYESDLKTRRRKIERGGGEGQGPQRPLRRLVLRDLGGELRKPASEPGRNW